MTGYSAAIPSDALLIQVPFTFEACVRGHRQRKARRKLYRSTASLEIERIKSAEVAFSIELAAGEAVDVLLYQNRLIWPLKYSIPFRHLVEADALQSLKDGALDLFSDAKLKNHTIALENDTSLRNIYSNGEEDAIALLWRRSKACIVVGDELYAEGGVPALVAKTPELTFSVYVASTGADRRGDPSIGGLFVQPGGFHLNALQKTLARGRFRMASNGECRPPHRKFPRIIVHREVPVDTIDLRIDATFRELWSILKIHPDWQGVDWLPAKFEAANENNGSDLSLARCEVLHTMLMAEPGLSGSEEGENVLAVLDMAAASGKTVTHSAYLDLVEKADDAALAALA